MDVPLRLRLQHVSTTRRALKFQQPDGVVNADWAQVHVALRGAQFLMPRRPLNRSRGRSKVCFLLTKP
jgi:hypothetical protein